METIHFEQGEPVNIPNAIVMVEGDYLPTDLVPVCKWGEDKEYTKVQAFFLKCGTWY